MFTGIIEELGTLASVRKSAKSAELEVRAHTVLDGTRTGDSIAVDGVCLTVKALGRNSFLADAMPETLRRSILGSLPVGSHVNLERALLPTTRLGGHIVSGHIDGAGTIASIANEDIAHVITIGASPSILRYVVEKGSVAIDGISLTVARVADGEFSVSVIPHTFGNTNLKSKKLGDKVNIECDVVGKYVERLISTDAQCEEGGSLRGVRRAASTDASNAPSGAGPSTLTADFLAANGF